MAGLKEKKRGLRRECGNKKKKNWFIVFRVPHRFWLTGILKVVVERINLQ